MQNRSYLIYFEYSKAHEDLQVLMRYLFLVRCLTAYQNRLEFPLRQGGYDDVFISNLIIFYNKLHFVDIVDINDSSPPNPITTKPPDCIDSDCRQRGCFREEAAPLHRERNTLAMRFMFCTAALEKDCSYMLLILSMRAWRRLCSSLASAKTRSMVSLRQA